MTRCTFAVGRRSAKTITLLVLHAAEPAPIVGPWTLTAVVSPN